MSGSVKSGLLFGLISLIVVGGLTVIPTLGQICCGPLGGMLIGGLAGYFAIRWSAPNAGIAQGVVAGGLAGIGTLLGTVIGFLLYFALMRSIPETRDLIEEAMRQQSGAGELTAEELNLLLDIAAPVAGLCLGVIWLLFGLGAGALGAWIAVRQRRGQEPPAVPPPVAVPPAMG